MDGAREHLMVLLTAGGLSPTDAVTGVGILSRYLLGSVATDGLWRSRREPTEVLRLTSLRHERYPLLHDAAQTYDDRNLVDTTHAGLDMILSGLRTLARVP